MFPDYIPEVPGFKYDPTTGQIREQRFYPQIKPMTKKDFLDICEEYLAGFEGKKIGVHLSGGFDTGLIISLLHYFKVPFNLYGLSTERWEFRTEHQIQRAFEPWGEKAFYVDMDEYPGYMGLEKHPFSQLPGSVSPAIAQVTALVDEAQKDGIEVMFEGQAGDCLFIPAIPTNPGGISFNFQEPMSSPGGDDYFYRPRSMRLISFFANEPMVEAIYNLRIGAKDDYYKLWGREFFKDILPRELSEYHYKAAFNGIYQDGLHEALPKFGEFYEEAYDLLKHPLFSPKEAKKVLSRNVYDEFRPIEHEEFYAKIGMVTWLHALFEH